MTRITLSILLAIASTQAQDSTATPPVAPAAPTTAPVAAKAPTAPDKPNALYIHPVSTGLTLVISAIPTWWYFTYERELGNGRSITLQPMFTTGEFDPEIFGADEDENPITVSQLGITAAYRIYTRSEESRSSYFAPAIMFSKLTVGQEGSYSYNYADARVQEEDIEISATTFGALIYGGFRSKGGTFSWYIDGGIGFRSVSLEVTGDDTDIDDIEDYSNTGLAYDVNYGIGIAF